MYEKTLRDRPKGGVQEGESLEEFSGNDLVKDLICAHKGVLGCKEPPRKMT